MFYGKNIDFFETKARIFADVDEITEDGDEYKELVAKLLIPNTSRISTRSGAERFLAHFEELSIQDKIEIVNRLSKAIIKLPMVCTEGTISDFNELKQSEKCEVVKSFLM